VLPLAEALQRLSDGTLPKRAAALTFDDGTRNLLTNAAPVLRELGMPAAVFLATGPMGTSEPLWPDRLWHAFAQATVPDVDLTALGLGIRSLRDEADRTDTLGAVHQKLKLLPDADRVEQVEAITTALGQHVIPPRGPFELLSWNEAKSLGSDGLITLYPHTVTHPILSRCDDEKVEHEVTKSCRVVEELTGSAPEIFAYPNGGESDFDHRAKTALHRNGIRWALSTTNGMAHRKSDPFALPRIGFAAHQSDAVFRLKVSGFGLRPRRTRASAARRPQEDRQLVTSARGG
jgi:peptidoglycan/xylan/chitin deacetylase (PgdA/CDA1 family)